MNFIDYLKNNSWAYAGSIFGNICGLATNLFRNASLFKNDFVSCKAPFHGIQPLVVINNYRESRKNIVSWIKPKPFHLVFPLIHLVPSLGFNAYNAICAHKQNKASISLKNRVAVMVKSTIVPAAHSLFLLFGFATVRVLLDEQTSRLGIDISGHIQVQCILGSHALHAAENMSDSATPSQIKMYSIAFLVCSVTDAIWAYNTAANCHSIADIVTGIACIAFTEMGFRATRQLWNSGCGFLKKLIFK